jgi:hypothetical protein
MLKGSMFLIVFGGIYYTWSDEAVIPISCQSKFDVFFIDFVPVVTYRSYLSFLACTTNKETHDLPHLISPFNHHENHAHVRLPHPSHVNRNKSIPSLAQQTS